jgi:hypothetical protein
MTAGPPLLTLLTLIGLALMAAGVVVRAMAFRRALFYAPAPLGAPVWAPTPPESTADSYRPQRGRTIPVTEPAEVHSRAARKQRLGSLIPARWPEAIGRRKAEPGEWPQPRPAERPEPEPPEPAGRPFPRFRRRLLTADRALFLACAAAYVAIGAVLALHFNSLIGDTQARVANAWYVLFSRDPHLGALGFVWQPLPSVLLLPILPFKAIWPALTQDAFAMVIESALTMAGSVCVLLGITRDLKLTRPTQWFIVALYALNPMIVYYAANGMSEALILARRLFPRTVRCV